MTLSAAYRRSVYRLRAVFVGLSCVLLAGSLLIIGRWPVAGVLLGLLSLGSMRLAAEVAYEIRGWRGRWHYIAPWQYEAQWQDEAWHPLDQW